MAKDHHYQAKLTWTGAASGPIENYAGYSREYRVEIIGKPPLTGSADPMFRGDSALHNPEDKLIAALSACHMLTYLALAAQAKVKVVAYEDDASGIMVLQGGGGHFTEVTLRPRVTVAPGCDLQHAQSLHQPANANCFIANSVNFPVHHEATVQEIT